MRKYSDLTANEQVIVKRCMEAILRLGEHEIVFEKVDGSIRVAKATLRPQVITEAVGKAEYDKEVNPAKPRAESIVSCRFFEVDAKQWRSFKMENLIAVAGNKIEDLIRI
ncbi:tail fibers protein [Aeromonas phage Ahp1_CNU-2021]|nr:tail fibers protein [Aeromonas phage Ahp1_CNU-2021]